MVTFATPFIFEREKDTNIECAKKRFGNSRVLCDFT